MYKKTNVYLKICNFIGLNTNSSSYTPTASSAPKITIKFDVTDQLQHAGTGGSCGIYVKPPKVGVTLTD